jgi:hypothetical protein
MGDGHAAPESRAVIAVPRRVVERVALVVTVLVLGWLAIRTHQTGHDWGDDFALYIRQAQGITEGFAHQVEADNRFSLQASAWSTFSPPIYPWGWPVLMAPVIAAVGVDYAALKLLVVACWCAALVWWFLIVRARAATIHAWLLLFALGLSWPYLTWSNSVVSDLPYLAVAFGTLWWMDNCRRHDAWGDGAWWRLAVLGVAMSFGFNIRRDGLALVVALGALLAVQIVTTLRRDGLNGCGARWRRWSLPFAVFVIASSVFQILLPSVIAPRYPGTGLSNVDDRLSWYRDILAEQLGLLAPDSDVIALLGSHRLGMAVLTLVLGLAVIGVVGRCITHPESDAPIAAFGVAHTTVVLIAPFQEGRYLFPIVPVLVYFAIQSIPTLFGRTPIDPARAEVGTQSLRPVAHRASLIATAVLVATLAISSATDSLWWASLATDMRREGVVMNGPARPEAVEMVRAVERLTDPDDVVAFFRARAMTMLTGRRSLQSGSIEPILAGADWYVMERGSTYSQPLLGPDDAASLGLEQVWSNSGWILFRLPAELRGSR